MMTLTSSKKIERQKTPALTWSTVIRPGPVERGMYLSREENPDADVFLERLVQVLSAERGEPTGVSGESERQERWHRRDSHVGSLLWLDTTGTWSPERLDFWATRHGLDPIRARRAIHVQACHGLADFCRLLRRIPNPALWAFPGQEQEKVPGAPSLFSRRALRYSRSSRPAFRPPSAVWWTPLVIIPDLAVALRPNELSGREAQEAYREVWLRLAHLRDRAIVAASVPTSLPSDVPTRWFTEISSLGFSR